LKNLIFYSESIFNHTSHGLLLLKMSSGGPNSQRFSPFNPPIKGSFPLDHKSKCDQYVLNYLACVKYYQKQSKKSTDNDETLFKSTTVACRPEAREYFKCRMENGLMEAEEFEKLGFFQDLDNNRANSLRADWTEEWFKPSGGQERFEEMKEKFKSA
jgi:cytochrome c oxidase assembly protein subunit 19